MAKCSKVFGLLDIIEFYILPRCDIVVIFIVSILFQQCTKSFFKCINDFFSGLIKRNMMVNYNIYTLFIYNDIWPIVIFSSLRFFLLRNILNLILRTKNVYWILIKHKFNFCKRRIYGPYTPL